MTLHPGIASHHANSQKRVGKAMVSFKYYHNGDLLEWKVSMAKAGSLQSGAGDSVVFFSDITVEDKRVVVVGDAPEEVRIETERRLDEVTKVEWTNVLVVRVDPKWSDYSNSHNTRCEGAGLSLSYETYQTGVTPAGKKVCRGWVPPQRYRSHNNYHESTPKYGTISHMDSPGGIVIPHTPEAQQALDSIRTALQTLGERVKGFLSEKAILATLSNVKVLGLPAPKGKKEHSDE